MDYGGLILCSSILFVIIINTVKNYFDLTGSKPASVPLPRQSGSSQQTIRIFLCVCHRFLFLGFNGFFCNSAICDTVTRGSFQLNIIISISPQNIAVGLLCMHNQQCWISIIINNVPDNYANYPVSNLRIHSSKNIRATKFTSEALWP